MNKYYLVVCETNGNIKRIEEVSKSLRKAKEVFKMFVNEKNNNVYLYLVLNNDRDQAILLKHTWLENGKIRKENRKYIKSYLIDVINPDKKLYDCDNCVSYEAENLKKAKKLMKSFYYDFKAEKKEGRIEMNIIYVYENYPDDVKVITLNSVNFDYNEYGEFQVTKYA